MTRFQYFLNKHRGSPIHFAVRQFLDFLNMSVDTSVWAYDFPKFNWADSMITIGVALLIFDMLVLETFRRKKLAGVPEGLRIHSI